MNKFEKVSLEQWKAAGGTEESYDKITLPVRKTKTSCGYDFATPTDITVEPHGKVLIPTGIRVELDDDKFLAIVPRSSVGIKKDAALSNTVAIIDSDYYGADNEGHIMISLRNMSCSETIQISAGDNFVHGIIAQYFVTVDDASDAVRTGGIGSTGA